MQHHVLQRILTVAFVLVFVPAIVSAQKRTRSKPRNIHTQKEKQSQSFLVKNFESGAIRLIMSGQLQAPRHLPEVPEHRYVPVPKGRNIPNRYPSTEIKLLDFRIEPSIVKNVVVLPNGAIPDQVDEPTVAVKGNFIFYTANHFAAFSSDGGQTFTYVSPWSA